MSIERQQKSKPDRMAAGGVPRRATHIALVAMFALSALLGAASMADAAAGDLFVAAPKTTTGATSTYTITYYVEDDLDGSSAEPVNFTTTFPGETDEFLLDEGSVSHEYPSQTHSVSKYRSGSGTDEDPVLTHLVFTIKRGVVENEKITYTMTVRNPFDAGTYPVTASIKDHPSGGIPPVTEDSSTEYTSTVNLQIKLSSSGSSNVDLNMPGLAGQPSSTTGNLVLTPASSTASVRLTLPFDFDVVSGTPSGWQTTQRQGYSTTTTEDDAPATMTYTGSALRPGQASTIPISGIIVTDHVGTFTFTTLERDSAGGQVRSDQFTFEIKPNLIEADYTEPSYGTGHAADEVTMRFTVDITNSLDAPSGDDAGHKFVVKFPEGFDLSGMTTNDVDLQVGTTIYAGSTTTIDANARTITFTMGSGQNWGAAQDATVYIRNVVTPTSIGVTGVFDFYTLNEDSVKVDQVVAANAPTFDVQRAGTLTDIGLTSRTVPSSSSEGLAGRPGAVDFEFIVATAEPDTLRFYLPDHYDLSFSSLTGSVTVGSQSASITPTFDKDGGFLEFNVASFSIASGDTVSGHFAGFTFPLDVGEQDVDIRTLNSRGGERDQGDGDFTVAANNLGSITADREKDGLSEVGGLTVTFDPDGLLVEDMQIVVTLNGQYSLSSVSASTNPTNVTVSGVTIDAADLTVSGSSVAIAVDSTIASKTGNLTVVIGDITNPVIRPSEVDGGSVSVALGYGGDIIATSDPAGLDTLVIPAGAPAAYHLTQESIKEANRLIVVDATETEDGVRISWTLPANRPVAAGTVVQPVGVQIWHSSSPYSLVDSYDRDDDEFTASEHLEEDGELEGTYLVTMYYEADIGRFTGSDAPSTDDYPGYSVNQMEVEEEGLNWTWQWFVLGGVILIAILVIVLAVMLSRRNQRSSRK